MGEGERPLLCETLRAGDPGVCDENDDRRELVPLCPDPGGGGFMALVLGVEGTEMELGVGGGWG